MYVHTSELQVQVLTCVSVIDYSTAQEHNEVMVTGKSETAVQR